MTPNIIPPDPDLPAPELAPFCPVDQVACELEQKGWLCPICQAGYEHESGTWTPSQIARFWAGR